MGSYVLELENKSNVYQPVVKKVASPELIKKLQDEIHKHHEADVLKDDHEEAETS